MGTHHSGLRWPCAGGPSALNAIGTQLRDPIIDAAAELGRNPVVSKHQIQPECGGAG